MIFELATAISAILTLLCSYRIVEGPETADRVTALDTIGTNVVALGAIYALYSEKQFYINISLMLAITGFIATVATSMYIKKGEIIK